MGVNRILDYIYGYHLSICFIVVSSSLDTCTTLHVLEIRLEVYSHRSLFWLVTSNEVKRIEMISKGVPRKSTIICSLFINISRYVWTFPITLRIVSYIFSIMTLTEDGVSLVIEFSNLWYKNSWMLLIKLNNIKICHY